MKKVSLQQGMLVASILTLSFSCQSNNNSRMKMESNSQCEEQCGDDCEDESPDDGDDEDEMSNLLPVQAEERVSVEPDQQSMESSAAEKQEESAPTPSLTEAAAPVPLSLNSLQEIDLETLAKMFSIEAEANETPAAPSVVETE